MTRVQIVEQSRNEDNRSFSALVRFDDEAEYQVTVTDPADEAVERELAWYFQEHLRYPFLDGDRRRAAVEQIATYGQDLFTQVFGGAASHDYRYCRDGLFAGCRIEVTGSSAFHRLHWETLRDPDLPTPLALRFPVVRRVEGRPRAFTVPQGRSTLNLLVITARPNGGRDVGYRTISRPLLDAVRQAQLPVTVDLVRPGTWAALRDRLRASTAEHGPGWYHVVHFDVHGAFTTLPANGDTPGAGDLLLADAPALLGGGGATGVLAFESERDGDHHLVTAADVAALLAEHGVPVVVLNACQSAMQTGTEASLAQDLVRAGIPVAVGMAYSVTVTAAERCMPVLYDHLARNADPVTAAHQARLQLHDQRGRRAYFNQDLDLEDWMLPVVFAQRPPRIHLDPMSDQERTAFYTRQAMVGSEPQVEYGFVGRDLDIQALERRLLLHSDRNQLLVRGMAGAGKSTLLEHAGWWWQRTGLVDQIFRFSYEDRAWTADQIIRDITRQIDGAVALAHLDAMPPAARLEQVAHQLRSHRHLLILDNAESITAHPAAIPHALDQPERDQLATLLSRLRGGRTLVLIGSRETETWLAPHAFDDNVYPLPGLDTQAASTLVQKICTRHGARVHLDDPALRQALDDLVNLLGGYPLPMTVVLPTLATHTPTQILDDLRTGGSDADPMATIQRSIEYSHGKLDPTTQNSLLLLAPFTATIPTGPLLEAYQQALTEDDVVGSLGPLDLAGAVDEAIRVGLATPHPQLGNWVRVQPVLPYFLRTRLRDQPALHNVADQAHYQLYQAIGALLHQMLTSHEPGERATGQAATRAEYANLTAALRHGLAHAQPIIAIIRSVEEYLDQSQQHAARRRLLDDAIAAYPTPDTQPRQYELCNLHNLAGHTALTQHRLDDAASHYQAELELRQTIGDRRTNAVTYHQLGMVAEERRRFDEAEIHYRQALDIHLEFGDRHSAASAYGQLGNLAYVRRRFDEAETHYRQALDIFLEFNDRHSAARTYHQLGMVAEERRRFDEAEIHYRQALDIKLEFNDRHSAASTYHQLGVLLAGQGRGAEALPTVLHAVVDWYHSTGSWATNAIDTVRQVRDQVPAAEFEQAVTTIVPADLVHELRQIVNDPGN